MREKTERFLLRGRRYLEFAIQYYVFERLRGLDFTMRDLEVSKKTMGMMHGYSKTSEKHLREIFDRLPFGQNLKILDIGCGKGVVLRESSGYAFKRIGGIDISGKLIETARNNFRILHLQNLIGCEQADAREFKGYGGYNVFFFFNPFCSEIFGEVLDLIIAEKGNSGEQVFLIYHNPVSGQLPEEKGFIRKHVLFDPLKQYQTYIFTRQF